LVIIHIVNWFQANQLILNMDKTNIVIFTTKCGTSHLFSFEYANQLLTEVLIFRFVWIINLIGIHIERLFPS
jgi:hypothetical protein